MTGRDSQSVGAGQGSLFHESIYEALRATVAGLGGAKQVSTILWPEKPIDEANRLLLDCLNPERAARLDPEKLLLLLKLGREKGIHVAMAWILEDAGYAPPVPLEPEDHQAELIRQFNLAAESVVAIGERLARLQITGIESRVGRR